MAGCYHFAGALSSDDLNLFTALYREHCEVSYHQQLDGGNLVIWILPSCTTVLPTRAVPTAKPLVHPPWVHATRILFLWLCLGLGIHWACFHHILVAGHSWCCGEPAVPNGGESVAPFLGWESQVGIGYTRNMLCTGPRQAVVLLALLKKTTPLSQE